MTTQSDPACARVRASISGLVALVAGLVPAVVVAQDEGKWGTYADQQVSTAQLPADCTPVPLWPPLRFIGAAGQGTVPDLTQMGWVPAGELLEVETISANLKAGPGEGHWGVVRWTTRPDGGVSFNGVAACQSSGWEPVCGWTPGAGALVLMPGEMVGFRTGAVREGGRYNVIIRGYRYRASCVRAAKRVHA